MKLDLKFSISRKFFIFVLWLSALFLHLNFLWWIWGLQEKYEQLTAHVDDLKQHLKDANRSSKAYELRIANMEEDIVENAEILGERKKEIASKAEEIQILQRRIGELEAKIESYLEDLEDKRAEIEQSSAMKQGIAFI